MAEIVTSNLNLSAPAGTIGSSSKTIDRLSVSSVTSTTLQAAAASDIFLRQSVGDVQVQSLQSNTGGVDLFAVGAIVDGSGENATADIVGNTIFLTSVNSSIGAADNPLELDVSSSASALTAFAKTGVYLTEISGAVNIGQLNASNGNIVFSQIDTPGNQESFELPKDSELSARNGSIILHLADNVSFAAGSRIISNQQVTVLVDQDVVANDAGATVSLDTQFLHGATWTLTTGDDADSIRIKGVNSFGTISMGLGNDSIVVGSDVGRLNLVTVGLLLDAGGGTDTLLLDASGASSEGVSGVVESSSRSGYSEKVSGFELLGAIDYGAFETVNLRLGAGPDTALIVSVGSDTSLSVFGGDGSDQFVVGNDTYGLSKVQGRLNLDGGTASDQLVINDLATAVCSVGLLTERSLSGFSMGSMSEGLRYDTFESLALNLASADAGEYQLSITSVATPTAIAFGEGDDSVLLGDSLYRIAADLTIDGGAEGSTGDRFSISSALSTDLQVGRETITATDMPGTIRLLGFESQDVTLSNAPDTVTVSDTGASLTLNLRGGADLATVLNVSHMTTVNLGDDTDRDQAIVRGASAMVEVFGNSAASDTLLIDTSADVSPATVHVADGTVAESLIVTGATVGEITGLNLATLSVQLGQG
ncbi:MAG: hypothetical protein KDB14_32615, partial [Planctomycetales bacterium]|nr:hypothetical protein [Planctomycetales bacterium]